MRFVFTHSHAFPGSAVSLEDDGQRGPGCLVEFSDGTIVIAEHERNDDDIVLRVPRYQTAKGNQIESRTWRLIKGADGTWLCRQSAA